MYIITVTLNTTILKLSIVKALFRGDYCHENEERAGKNCQNYTVFSYHNILLP